MKLTLEGIKNTTVFQKAGILLPGYDVAAVSKKAKQAPRWAHFGIGNIFRIFIGGIADGYWRPVYLTVVSPASRRLTMMS